LGHITSSDAQVTPPGFGGFKHIRWTPHEGAPGTVYKINQTPDGYLWLAGNSLYRFDGASFETIEYPAGAPQHAWPSELMVSQSGELWVGLSNKAGVAVYRAGQLVDMHMPDPPGAVGVMVQTPDGTIWFASGMFDHQLRRLRGDQWETVGEKFGLPEGAVMGMKSNSLGGLWIALTHRDGQTGALAYLAPGADRFQELPIQLAARPKIALDPEGALWVSDASGTRMLFDPQGMPPVPQIQFPSLKNVRIALPAFDRRGGIWGSTASVGIFYIPERGLTGKISPVYQFTAANGLTSDFAYQPFVDREGSIWFATENGLDQFRRAGATQELTIPADPINGLAITQAKDGSIYITSQDALFRVEPGQVPRPIEKLNIGETMICAAQDDGIWAITANQVLRIQNDHATALPHYPSEEPPTACAEDQQRRLWIALFNGKLIWRDSSGWHTHDAPISKRVWAMTGTHWGDVAFDTRKSEVALIRNGDLAVLDLSPFDLGMRTMIASGLRDLFMGRDYGLIRLRDTQFQSLSEQRFPWIGDLRSLVQTPQGDTWMISRNRIFRVATADLDHAFEDPAAQLPVKIFDARDGLDSTMQHPGFTGVQSAVGGDGRVWFLNRQGAAYFDPKTLEKNQLAPPVAIRSLTGGGRTWRDPIGPVLPPGSHVVDIAYAGLSLAIPQRINFRYRLEGIDDDWVNAGARRSASYANLSPGKYVFRVIAMNNDGVWNNAGAALEFEILPTFFESWPFKVICGLALFALLWLFYAVRLRAVAARIRQRMADRMAERERIARELHDTLLQSVQTLTLRFQMAVDDLPHEIPARTTLEGALDLADRTIAEGRDRVRDLRAIQDSDIGQIICDIVARQGFDPGVVIEINNTGAPKIYEPLALDEIARIAGEAIFNIRRHAFASRVVIEIMQTKEFQMRFTDNGVGLPAEIIEQGGKAGHYGLPGMRERAHKLHGQLMVRRLPEGGTELLLKIPGAFAYRPSRRPWFPRFWRSN
jgi:signal transduction histidine kinase/ligand-binding sensor domain-containing protein